MNHVKIFKGQPRQFALSELVECFAKNMMMNQQFPRIRYVSQFSFVGGQFAITIHQIVNLSPRPKLIQQLHLVPPTTALRARMPHALSMPVRTFCLRMFAIFVVFA